jgi:hypothetical protein
MRRAERPARNADGRSKLIVRRLDLLLLPSPVANLPSAIKIISGNDPQASSNLGILTVLSHLQEMPSPPPILFW